MFRETAGTAGTAPSRAARPA
jgi:hypothetical protein